MIGAFDETPNAAQLMRLAVQGGLDADGGFNAHVERAIDVDDRTFMIRCRQDARTRERSQLAESVEGDIRSESGLRDYIDTDAYGDSLVIVALSADSLGATLASTEHGSPVTIAARGQDDSANYIGILQDGAQDGRRRISDLGLDENSTIGDLFAKLDVALHPGESLFAKVLVDA